MTLHPITNVVAWEALDSRGRPTVGCRVEVEGGGSGRVVVPAGASTGRREAAELRDGGTRYSGQGVRQAVAHANGALRDVVCSREFQHQSELDAALEAADGTSTLKRLGANAVLAVSIASMLADADSRRVPLWATGEHAITLPMPMVNIISGGAHAAGAIDIQDVLVVPLCATAFSEAIEIASAVRATTSELMASRGMQTALVADEGGLAAPLRRNEEALELVTAGIEAAGLVPGRDAALAVDLAANQFAHEGALRLKSEDRDVTHNEWINEVLRWIEEYPIISVEDILPDDAWDSWLTASELLRNRVQLVGDDLFATDSATVSRAIKDSIANAVLIKLNQTGTVTRAKTTLSTAQEGGYSTVISARSGDSEDYWLADLAVAWNVGQIKVGSVMRSERTSKWNRLLEIEATTGAALAALGDRLGEPLATPPA